MLIYFYFCFKKKLEKKNSLEIESASSVIIPDKLKKKLRDRNIHTFVSDGICFLLTEYPHLDAYMVDGEHQMWFPVFPKINFRTRKADFLNPSSSSVWHSDSADEEKLNLVINSIPVVIRNEIKKFKDSHWEFALAAVKGKIYFEKLLTTNPALTYIIVNLDKLNPAYSPFSVLDYTEAMVLKKQKKILSHAGFEVSDSFVKLISEITNEFCTIQNFERLKFIVNHKTEEYLWIAEFILQTKTIPKNFDILFRMNSYSFHFLRAKTKKQILQSVEKITALQKFSRNILRMRSLRMKPHTLKSIKNLDELNQRMETEIEYIETNVNRLPAAPFADADYITSIITITELNEWSARQKNCVNTYSNKIKNLETAIYKIEYPGEEATLELKIRGNQITIGDLKAKANMPVSKNLINFVMQWFEREIVKMNS